MTDVMTSPRTQRRGQDSRVALTLYLGNLTPSGRRSMRSLLQQVAALQRWSGELEAMPWLTLRYEQVAKIRAQLRQANKSPNTINTTLAALRGVLKAGFLLDRFPAQEWQRIQSIDRVPRQRLPAGRCLSGKEINRLLDICRQDASLPGSRDAAVLALLAYAGLRRSEVVSLNIADYVSRSGLLYVKEGKGGHPRELVLPVLARTVLRRWLKYRGSAPGPLFCQLAKTGGCDSTQRLSAAQIYGLLKRRVRKAGLAPCSPHDLRRTFVTRLLEQGVDFNTTRQLAGHEHMQTTALYDRRQAKTQKQAMANLRF